MATNTFQSLTDYFDTIIRSLPKRAHPPPQNKRLVRRALELCTAENDHLDGPLGRFFKISTGNGARLAPTPWEALLKTAEITGRLQKETSLGMANAALEEEMVRMSLRIDGTSLTGRISSSSISTVTATRTLRSRLIDCEE